MLLFKILQKFLLPSVFSFVLILVGLFFLLKFKKRKIRKAGKILLITGIVFYYIFSISPTADLILGPLEKQYSVVKENELDKADKIVLLLGTGENNVLRASEVLRISNIKNQKVKIIIAGTNPLNPESNPAEEVKKYLIERGIPSENIILENESRNTAESAKNIKKILQEEPFFLVTSAYHMPRSMEVFKKMRTNPIPAPTDFKTEKSHSIFDFFPSASNLNKADIAFHEYFGIIFYRLYY